MYLPLGFFSQKKKVREASLAPLAHGLHTSSMLGFATNIQWKCWVTRAFSIIATTNQIFIQHSIVLLHD